MNSLPSGLSVLMANEPAVGTAPHPRRRQVNIRSDDAGCCCDPASCQEAVHAERPEESACQPAAKTATHRASEEFPNAVVVSLGSAHRSRLRHVAIGPRE